MTLEPEESHQIATEFVSDMVDRLCSVDLKAKRRLRKRHFRLRLYEHCFRILYGGDSSYLMQESKEDGTLSDASNSNKSKEVDDIIEDQWIKPKIVTRETRSFNERNQAPKKQVKKVEEVVNPIPEMNPLDGVIEWIAANRMESDKVEPIKAVRKPTPIKTRKFYNNKKLLIKAAPPSPKPYAHRVVSAPVISQRKSVLPKKNMVVQKEIEADQLEIQKFAAKKQILKRKSIASEAQTSTRSWLSEKKASDSGTERKQDEVSFERTWSSWSLKKAEMLDWDPDMEVILTHQ